MSTEFGDEKTCFSPSAASAGRFPRMVDIQVVARPLAPVGASPLDAPGSIILEDLESVSTTLFCCSCMDYSFRLLFAFVPMCRSRQAQFFLQVFFSTAHVCTCTQHDHDDTSGPTRGIPIDQQIGKKNPTGTVCTRGTDTFSVLAHSFSPFVSHFDTHFLHLGDSPVLCGSTHTHTHVRCTYACKSRDLKAADSGLPLRSLYCAIHPLSRLHGALLRKPQNFILLASSNFILLHPGTQHHRVTPPIGRLTLTPLALTSPQGQVSLAG